MDGSKPKKSALPLIIGLGCAGMLLFAVLVAGVIILFVSKIMKGNQPYQDSIAAVQANPAAIQVLGEPIKEGFFTSGSISVNGASGEASLAIPVAGPKSKGTIYVEGEKTAGIWSYSVMELAPAGGGQRISLIESIDGL